MSYVKGIKNLGDEDWNGGRDDRCFPSKHTLAKKVRGVGVRKMASRSQAGSAEE